LGGAPCVAGSEVDPDAMAGDFASAHLVVAAGGVGVDGPGRGRDGLVGRPGRELGGPASIRCGPTDAAVGPLIVVVGDEVFEADVEGGEAGEEFAPDAEPFFEGLLKAFDLAAGL